jgi:hypothetical protein
MPAAHACIGFGSSKNGVFLTFWFFGSAFSIFFLSGDDVFLINGLFY